MVFKRVKYYGGALRKRGAGGQVLCQLRTLAAATVSEGENESSTAEVRRKILFSDAQRSWGN